jgi:hypothetical protein
MGGILLLPVLCCDGLRCAMLCYAELPHGIVGRQHVGVNCYRAGGFCVRLLSVVLFHHCCWHTLQCVQ